MVIDQLPERELHAVEILGILAGAMDDIERRDPALLLGDPVLADHAEAATHVVEWNAVFAEAVEVQRVLAHERDSTGAVADHLLPAFPVPRVEIALEIDGGVRLVAHLDSFGLGTIGPCGRRGRSRRMRGHRADAFRGRRARELFHRILRVSIRVFGHFNRARVDGGS